eukprot:CAMPEP_0202699852 /NCGR_PEP_ID=MMETSP1385-20130828/13068_1 /ASSEMBLY_ACC=CAM_ASM_000861 /TAXON_ID=933848 /ORGANISM="Elphidium margaritaceum" /LENGTH=203 /DNA_ID=CAMNT_0049356897 /DNA_START=17 /DNA_END=625 /DNA_ORIENTATION=-
MKVPNDRDLLEYSKSVKCIVIDHTATSFEHSQCHLCEMYVDDASMEDHLNTVCPQSVIECSLCQQRMQRKELHGHWKDGALCNSYVLYCNEDTVAANVAEFKQYAFDTAYPKFNEEVKYDWCFNTDEENSDVFKQLYLKSDVKRTHFVCSKCGQRCEHPFEWDEHVCVDYINNPPENHAAYYLMRLTVPRLYGIDVVDNVLRK